MQLKKIPSFLAAVKYTLYIYVVNKLDSPNSNTNSYISKSGPILKTMAFWLPRFYGWILNVHLLRKRTFTLIISKDIFIFQFKNYEKKRTLAFI